MHLLHILNASGETLRNITVRLSSERLQLLQIRLAHGRRTDACRPALSRRPPCGDYEPEAKSAQAAEIHKAVPNFVRVERTSGFALPRVSTAAR